MKVPKWLGWILPRTWVEERPGPTRVESPTQLIPRNLGEGAAVGGALAAAGGPTALAISTGAVAAASGPAIMALGSALLVGVLAARAEAISRALDELPETIRARVMQLLEEDEEFRDFFYDSCAKLRVGLREEKLRVWRNIVGQGAENTQNIRRFELFMMVFDELTQADIIVLAHFYRPLPDGLDPRVFTGPLFLRFLDGGGREIDDTLVHASIRRLEARHLLGAYRAGMERQARGIASLNIGSWHPSDFGREFFNTINRCPGRAFEPQALRLDQIKDPRNPNWPQLPPPAAKAAGA
ncbi:MAG TPA: hypothetical protein VK914_03315 [bacterium]|nr:hypothetical protein [bacterium]